jgi:hypothetical protein
MKFFGKGQQTYQSELHRPGVKLDKKLIWVIL